MRVRLSGAFVTRWLEEWQLAADMIGRDRYTERVESDKLRIELFLEQFGPEIARVLKHQLLEALLADTAAKAQLAEVGHSETLGDA